MWNVSDIHAMNDVARTCCGLGLNIYCSISFGWNLYKQSLDFLSIEEHLATRGPTSCGCHKMDQTKQYTRASHLHCNILSADPSNNPSRETHGDTPTSQHGLSYKGRQLNTVWLQIKYHSNDAEISCRLPGHYAVRTCIILARRSAG
jgi:hypothetical protein